MNKKCTFQVCFFVVFLLGVVYNPIFGQSLPRPEYPRPQFERKDWINLNGEWTYQFDFGKSGTENGFTNSKGFPNKIIAPRVNCLVWGIQILLIHCGISAPLKYLKPGMAKK